MRLSIDLSYKENLVLYSDLKKKKKSLGHDTNWFLV